MKKNLHFVLALTLGLATTVSAQDWSVDSRTRVNSTEDATSTDQRVRTAVDFGFGVAVSAQVELLTLVQHTLGSDFTESRSSNGGVMDFDWLLHYVKLMLLNLQQLILIDFAYSNCWSYGFKLW